MVKVGSLMKVIDNTGAKQARCLKIQPGYKRGYAGLGDIVTVSVQSLRVKRRESIKIKKGEIYKALILRVKSNRLVFSGDCFSYNETSSIILLTKQKKILGTRVFGSISKVFRFTNYLKVISMSYGTHSF